ncbi:hypothetical protein DPX16_12171 [Anabarilius grahami]|uniref:Uncharacterized protein n=1 Tax=Anabarilius grahami TaxID=495550 RepID=A0A3N0YQS7_ANAGA|nr:hypothetical protein DPX16_12171 [Anabarilius grahami]
MMAVILVLALVFCGLSSTSLRFIRRPLAQRSMNTVTSTYFYPSPRLEYLSPFSHSPLQSFPYGSNFFPYYNPSLCNPLGSQVYTHYPYLSGGQINPLIISVRAV